MKKTNHDGDCTIYAVLHNGCPTDGICTCGYGLQQLRDGGSTESMLSAERQEALYTPPAIPEDVVVLLAGRFKDLNHHLDFLFDEDTFDDSDLVSEVPNAREHVQRLQGEIRDLVLKLSKEKISSETLALFKHTVQELVDLVEGSDHIRENWPDEDLTKRRILERAFLLRIILS